jgi:5-(carboxyamino)imidazole ribonucleotide synthase
MPCWRIPIRKKTPDRVKKVGIIGAGQLGLMLANAGKSLGLEFAFLDPAVNPPALAAGPVLQRPFDSDEGLAMLAGCDVVTYEFENVPVEAVEKLSQHVPVFPPAHALEQAQDRLREKELFEAIGIPVPPWRRVSSRGDLEEAIAAIGLPLILKTRRLGYDGKGQAVVRNREDVDAAWQALGASPLLAEQLVDFDREISVFGVRSPDGQVLAYPMTQNEHRDGILHVSRAPARGDAVAQAATRHLQELLARLDYVGILALEMFVVGNIVLANEFAPRVHNSGHWTIEGSRTSQFENHLRAVVGLPLGDTTPTGHAGMVNLIGSLPEDCAGLRASGAYVHDYGKQARPGRKLGHVTVIASDAATRDRKLSNVLKVLGS